MSDSIIGFHDQVSGNLGRANRQMVRKQLNLKPAAFTRRIVKKPGSEESMFRDLNLPQLPLMSEAHQARREYRTRSPMPWQGEPVWNDFHWRTDIGVYWN